MSKIVPIVIVLVGILSGLGVGLFLRPAPQVISNCEIIKDSHGNEVEHCEEPEHEEVSAGTHGEEVDPSSVNYVKLSNQFVIPVVNNNEVSALVVMSLSIETIPAMTETVYNVEPKLRDAFLRVMFLHANSGGFDGQFTGGEPMKDLRGSLLEAAQEILGSVVTAVLVTDILRQDV